MALPPYLRDHHLEGKVILPAVESLIMMAGAVRTHYPRTEIACLKNAEFRRFLNIELETARQTFVCDLEDSCDGGIAVTLLTALKSKTANIRREMIQAKVSFYPADAEASPELPFISADKLKGSCISVPAATVYRELVTFGKAYQNIMGDLSVSPEGAVAYISGGNEEADEDLLGSPFPLDATMHAACVWGQRYAGVVSFPVGFQKRTIYQKTKKREEYLGRVVPVNITEESLIFDAWIYKDNIMYEQISGLIMKDVTRGRMKPPEWIKA